MHPGLPKQNIERMNTRQSLIDELNALWMKAEGNYNVFDKSIREAIGKAYKVEPWRLQRQVSFNRILSGDFSVAEGKHGNLVIE